MMKIGRYIVFVVLCLLAGSVFGQGHKVERKRPSSSANVKSAPKPKPQVSNRGNRPVFKSESFKNGNLMFITINNKFIHVKADKEIKPK